MAVVTVIGVGANTLFGKKNGFKGKESRRLHQLCMIWSPKEQSTVTKSVRPS
jgi:hypothetical protein